MKLKLIFLGVMFVCMLVISLSIGLSSCTDNAMVKRFGGSMTIDLPKNSKLINITWKDEQIWYLTREMKDSDSVDTYTFSEKSSFGINEGKITIKESK